MDDFERAAAIRLVADAFVATVNDKTTSRLRPKTRVEMLVITTTVRETLWHMQGDSRSSVVGNAWASACRKIDGAADAWWQSMRSQATVPA
jgi:hypothetical protein